MEHQRPAEHRLISRSGVKWCVAGGRGGGRGTGTGISGGRKGKSPTWPPGGGGPGPISPRKTTDPGPGPPGATCEDATPAARNRNGPPDAEGQPNQGKWPGKKKRISARPGRPSCAARTPKGEHVKRPKGAKRPEVQEAGRGKQKGGGHQLGRPPQSHVRAAAATRGAWDKQQRPPGTGALFGPGSRILHPQPSHQEGDATLAR